MANAARLPQRPRCPPARSLAWQPLMAKTAAAVSATTGFQAFLTSCIWHLLSMPPTLGRLPGPHQCRPCTRIRPAAGPDFSGPARRTSPRLQTRMSPCRCAWHCSSSARPRTLGPGGGRSSSGSRSPPEHRGERSISWSSAGPRWSAAVVVLRERRRMRSAAVRVGVWWFVGELASPAVGLALAFTVGLVLSAAGPALVAHLALSYPTGRIAGVAVHGHRG